MPPRQITKKLKNPTPLRTEQYYDAILAHYSGLTTFRDTSITINKLNKSARKRKQDSYLDPLDLPTIPNAIYDTGTIAFQWGRTSEDFVRDSWKILRALPFGEFRLLVNKTHSDRDNVDIVIRNYRKYSRKETKGAELCYREQFMLAYPEDDWVFDYGDRMVILQPTTITAERLFQHYAEGISNCVFKPIYKKFEKLFDNCNSTDRMRKLRKYVKDLKVLEEQYKTGVPEDCMETIAKTAHIKMPFSDVFERNEVTYNENGKVATVTLQNVRFNHVEEGNLVLNAEPEIVSQEEINKIWSDCHTNNEFYNISGDIKNGNIRKIKTLTKIYEVDNPVNKILAEFSNSIKLDNYKFNAYKFPEVHQFIKAGTIIHSEPIQLNAGVATGHIDMRKAYTQFQHCHMYSGFLGVIHQCGSDNFDVKYITEHIGIYKFTVTKCDNELLVKLGLGLDTIHILPSVEILYYMSIGLECKVTEGVWGSTMDFEFTDTMLMKDEGISRYAKWCGKLMAEIKDVKHTVKATPEYASRLKYDYPDLVYWQDRGVATVTVPINGLSTATHIMSFITAYVRIQMIEQMRQFDVNNIIAVVMDGIYFKGAKPAVSELFVDKPIGEFRYYGDAWFYGSFNTIGDYPIYFNGNTLLTGQGGAGKTYGVMNTKNLNTVLYVVPCHLLGQDGNEKYHCRYITIHKLLGKECTAYHLDHKTPPVILVDEITQYPAEWITEIFEMYKDSLIILAGDIIESGQWFQCRTGIPGKFAEIWKPVNVDIVNVAGDRRAQDSSLKEMKLKIRDKMMEVFIDGDSGENDVIKAWAKAVFPTVSYGEAIGTFETGDIWLAATHRINNILLTAGVCSGYYKEGGKISAEPLPGYTKRGSMTIHSIQGKTIKSGKIYISVDDLFEYAMLYTAVSRACYIEQIVLVA